MNFSGGHKKSKKHFILTACIYTNSNNILNDDIYEYESIGIPFLAEIARELIYKKRHVCRQKMADDLMDVSIDWDTNLTPSEVWIPKGRLVAHVHEHTGKFIFTLVLIILN